MYHIILVVDYIEKVDHRNSGDVDYVEERQEMGLLDQL